MGIERRDGERKLAKMISCELERGDTVMNELCGKDSVRGEESFHLDEGRTSQ